MRMDRYFTAMAPTMDSKILKPSVPPSSGSLERSGCGIIPSTFRPGLQIPAMLSSDPLGLASARNLAGRGTVSKHNLLVAVQLGESCFVAEIVAFHVADGDGQHFALMAGAGKRSFRVLDPYLDRFADVLQPDIAHQGSGQQAGLAQNLEAIANPQHQSAAGGELPHRFHHRREFGDGAGAQIVAIGESAGHDDGIAVLQIMGFVPQECDRLSVPHCWMVQYASWSQLDPGKMMTPNFIVVRTSLSASSVRRPIQL